MEVVKSRLLLSLDDLLDTRAGTLCDLNPKLTAELLLDPAYAERIIDVFKGFNKANFDKRYKERDKKVLSLSTSTKVGVIIFDFVQRVVNRNLESPFSMDPVVHINMYPYNLTEKEQGYIRAAVLAKLPIKPEVDFVNLSPEQITPQLLKENYKTAIMYHFWGVPARWSRAHAARCERAHPPPCPAACRPSRCRCPPSPPSLHGRRAA